MSAKVNPFAIEPVDLNVRLRAAVSGVAATAVLTSDNTNVTDGKKVVVGTKEYTFKTNLTQEIAATGVLTWDNAVQPAAGKKVTIGDVEYIFAASITAAVAATAVLTSDETNVTNGDTVTVGTQIYTFVTTLSGLPYEIKIGADADTTLANLVAAINGAAGIGVKYGYNTMVHPLVSAGAVAVHATTLTARSTGTGGNAIAKAENSTHLDFDGAGAAFTGGVNSIPNQILIGAAGDDTMANLAAAINGAAGEGTTYGWGTVANPYVTSGAVIAHAITVTAIEKGVDGNAIAKAEDDAHLDWDGAGATLTGGVGGKARVTLTSNNINVADGVQVTLGAVVYTFKTTLTKIPEHVAYEVKIGVDANGSLQNLVSAINGTAGAGSTYASGTNPHPYIYAEAVNVGAHTVVLKGREHGASYNLGCSDTSATLSWGAPTLTGGVSDIANEIKIGADADTSLGNLEAAINGAPGAGLKYGVGTVANELASSGAVVAHALTMTALAVGTAGNAIAKSEDDAHLDWDGAGAAFTGGVDEVTVLGGTADIPNSGYVTKIIAKAPAMDGGATTFTVALKDDNGNQYYVTGNCNESATTVTDLADKPLMVNPGDTVLVTPSVAQADHTIAVSLR